MGLWGKEGGPVYNLVLFNFVLVAAQVERVIICSILGEMKKSDYSQRRPATGCDPQVNHGDVGGTMP